MGITTIPPMPLPKDPEQRAAALEALRRHNERQLDRINREPDFSIGGLGWVAILALALGGFGG